MAFDVAYEIDRQPVRELLGQPSRSLWSIRVNASPRHLFFLPATNGPAPALERYWAAGPIRMIE